MTRLALAEILGHAEHNGLYRLPPGMTVAGATRIPGCQLTDKTAMLKAVADVLAFPDYYGANWDALEECLTDLSWWEGAVALLIDEATTPEDKAPETWGMLLDILAEAARFWAAQGRPFAVFLQGGHAAYPKVVA
jgi:RNAse (barnase) inhibitor barstar